MQKFIDKNETLIEGKDVFENGCMPNQSFWILEGITAASPLSPDQEH